MKEKLTNYIKNEQTYEERHVSNTDRVGKRYRNMASVFTIGDEEEGMFGAWGRCKGGGVQCWKTWINKNKTISEQRHVGNTDRVGKRYPNMASMFTVGDEEEGMFGA